MPYGKMTTNTKIKRTSNRIETGTFKIDKKIGLTKIISLTVKKANNIRAGHITLKTAYNVSVTSTHPIFGNINFSFIYDHIKRNSYQFKNGNGNIICMGVRPKGELKDIVISALSHESYSYQLSKNVTTWLHAEKNPNNGEYLLWYYKYYRIYSPRLKWELPARCVREQLWKTHECNLCSGNKCEFLSFFCEVCGQKTKNLCCKCKSAVCNNHSHCINHHYVLTKTGMFEGKCSSCNEKIEIGNKKCRLCGNDKIVKF